jgi:hypothetical protein
MRVVSNFIETSKNLDLDLPNNKAANTIIFDLEKDANKPNE